MVLVSAEGRDFGKQKSWSKSQAKAIEGRLLVDADQVSIACLLTVARTESGF